MGERTIDLTGLDRETLLIVAERACSALCRIASNLTSSEADRDDTEEDIGLSFEEVVESAHDDMIGDARGALDAAIYEINHFRHRPVASTQTQGTPNG